MAGTEPLPADEWPQFRDDLLSKGLVPSWLGCPPGTPDSLFWLSRRRVFISVNQLIDLLKKLKTDEEKVSMCQCMFSRLSNPHHFQKVLETLVIPTKAKLKEGLNTVQMASALNPKELLECNRLKFAVIDRIGWLNCWSPLFAEGFYSLDLSKRDERNVCMILVYLAVIEPGENWLAETYNGRDFELPGTWTTDCPTKGVTTTT